MSERTPSPELRGLVESTAAGAAVQRVADAINDLVAAIPRIDSALRSGAPGLDAVAAAVTDLSAGVMDACVACTGIAISSSLFDMACATYCFGVAVGQVSETASEDHLAVVTKQLLDTQLSFNLQYLQLQSQMQAENRAYTAVSNIMKAKHDTVKNSISNIH